MFDFISEREIETRFSLRGKRKTERYLKGPVPLAPLVIAGNLPGQALALYLCVRHRRDLTGAELVTLPTDLMQQFGISRYAKARALKALEAAGLIEVERESGHTAKVRLVLLLDTES